jgi:hypothetical protein
MSQIPVPQEPPFLVIPRQIAAFQFQRNPECASIATVCSASLERTEPASPSLSGGLAVLAWTGLPPFEFAGVEAGGLSTLRPALDRNFRSKAFDPVQDFLLGKQALLREQLNQRLELDHVRVREFLNGDCT